MLPPIVPRLRIAAWPINGSAAASSGTFADRLRPLGHVSRVIAPISTRPSTARGTPLRPLMSIRRAGRASRSCQQWDQALASGEHPGLVPEVSQQADRFVHSRGRLVLNGGSFIGTRPSTPNDSRGFDPSDVTHPRRDPEESDQKRSTELSSR